MHVTAPNYDIINTDMLLTDVQTWWVCPFYEWAETWRTNKMKYGKSVAGVLGDSYIALVQAIWLGGGANYDNLILWLMASAVCMNLSQSTLQVPNRIVYIRPSDQKYDPKLAEIYICIYILVKCYH